MAHSWEAPANVAREILLDTIKDHVSDLHYRKEVVDLALEEIDRQFGDPDDEMVAAGMVALNAYFGHATVHWSEFRRRTVIEEIWRAMVDKAFGR